MENNEMLSIADINYLTNENCKFIENNGFLGFENKDKQYERIYLQRNFPFEEPFRYISVLDEDNTEIGIIIDIDNFDTKECNMIKKELNRRYYMLKIQEIISIKEKYGFSYWNVKTNDGEAELTLRDTQKSILKINNKRLIICDVDGNRYEIEDLSTLGKSSYKKIEIYL